MGSVSRFTMFGRVELNHLPQVPGWWSIDMATWYGPETGLITLNICAPSEQTQMESVVWSSYNAYCICRLCVERGDIFGSVYLCCYKFA